MTVIEAPQPVVRGPQVWPFGVKECWLVLGPEQQIKVHRQPQGGQFAEHAVRGPGGTLTSAVVPGLTAELDRLFAT